LLTPVLADHGFRLEKDGRERSFVRAIPGGNQRIGIPIQVYDFIFCFSIVVIVGLDAVDQLVMKFCPAPSKRYRHWPTTFFVNLERLMPNLREFEVTEEDEIRQAFATLNPVLTEKILPFLDRNQDLNAVATSMDLTTIPKLHTGDRNSLAVACLTRHPAFEKIAKAHLGLCPNFPSLTVKTSFVILNFFADCT
jgi:hypothetical protein